MCRTPWKGERWLREECITVPASQKSGTSFSSNLRGRKELRNSKISRKSSLKKWISGHQSLQRDLREPLVRVRPTYGIIHSIGTNASTLSSLENAFMRSIVKKWLVRSVLVHSAYILNVQNHKNGCNFFLGCAHEIPSRLKRSRFQMFRGPGF